jgi:hypothetical protein
LDRRLDGTQNWTGRHGEEKILDPNRPRTLTRRSSSPKLDLKFSRVIIIIIIIIIIVVVIIVIIIIIIIGLAAVGSTHK